MADIRKLTLLHSNDLHGDFMEEHLDSALVGGVSRLSGYVHKVRNEEENVLYAIAGDMFRGSLIDSEYKGVSTIEIMNLLGPDVVTLGNHEVDYGVAHLLFLEKCAEFPIINANMYLRERGIRLFRPYIIERIRGMKIMFIGVLTEETLAQTKNEGIIGTLVDIYDAAQEIGRICDAYQTEDIDLTVLLTHIGFDADKKLAELLDPRWGIDVIIGGHSHTLLEQPTVVNGIPIVQAAYGTDQIGRFDIEIDMETNSLWDYKWELIPINEKTCPRDPALEDVLLSYKDETDRKYRKILTRFAEAYTHPQRNKETMLGHVFSDVIQDVTGADLVLIASGAIRQQKLGPIITKEDLMVCYPFNAELYRIYVTGAQLKHMISYMLREEAFDEDCHTEFYQPSKGFRAEWDRKTGTMLSMKLDGVEIADDQEIRVCLEKYHFLNMKTSFDITEQEVKKNSHIPRVVATKVTDVVEEYFLSHGLIEANTDQRLVIHA